MNTTTSHLDAQSEIRRDLGRLRRERLTMLVGYLALVGMLLAYVWVSPGHGDALEHDATWYAALLLLFATSVGGAALTVGVPLVSRQTMYAAGAVFGAAVVGALLLVLDMSSAGPDDPWAAGAGCFIACTVISGMCLVALGLLSGRLWRRFPNPGWIMAVGITAVGLSALHMQCGATDLGHLFLSHLGPIVVVYAVARGLLWLRETVLRDDGV